MMNDVQQLYQQVIIDHGRHPRNFGRCPEATCCQEGYNPLCGDRVTVYAKKHTDGNRVDAVCFEGEGCAISLASASLMTEAVKGLSLENIENMFRVFHQLVTEAKMSPDMLSEEDQAMLGKLTVLSGVAAYPMRVKCATLVWHTLIGALGNVEEPVVVDA